VAVGAVDRMAMPAPKVVVPEDSAVPSNERQVGPLIPGVEERIDEEFGLQIDAELHGNDRSSDSPDGFLKSPAGRG